MDTLQSSLLANCQRVCLSTEPDYSKATPGGLFTHGGIQGDIKVFAATAEDTFKTMDSKKPRTDALLTFHVVCKSRSKGDMKVTVLDSNETTLAAFGRKEALSLFMSSKKAETQIPILLSNNTDKETLANIVPSIKRKHGTIEYGDNQHATRLSAVVPAWQASTKWILCAFVSFIPTFGLGGCVGFCMALRSTLLTRVEKQTRTGTTIKLPDAESKGDLTFLNLQELTDWEDKLALILLFGYLAADDMASPPKSNSNGGPSGGPSF